MADEVGGVYMPVLPELKSFGSKLKSGVSSEVARVSNTTGDDFGRGFTSRAGRGIASRAKGIFSGLAKGGAVAAVAAGAAVGKVLFDSIGEARESQVVTARTENVIKSMGNQAKISASQVADLSMAISNKAAIDDEAIQSGQNLLLTFGNIRNEVDGEFVGTFNRASYLMADMSKAMGQDMKSSAIQLGKALNDPIKGVSALSRVGVSFTEQQKEQIKKLTESGDMVGAQNIILGELQKQFGGAAESMATPAERAQVAWGNFKEELGTAVLPLVDRILTGLADYLPKVLVAGKALATQLAPTFATVRDLAADVFEVIKAGVVAALPVIRNIATGVGSMLGDLRGGASDLTPTFQKIGDVVRDVFGQVKAAFGDKKTIGQFVSFVRNAATTIRDVFKSAVDIITVLWNKFGANVVQFLRSSFGNVMQIVRGAFQVIKGIFDTIAGVLTGDWDRAWEGIKDILRGAWKVVVGLVRQGFNALRFAFKNAGVILASIWRKLWPIIKDLAKRGLDALVGFVKSLPGRFVSGLKALPGVVGTVIRRAFDGWKTIVRVAVDKLVDFVKGIPGRLRDLGRLFGRAGGWIIDKFVDGLKGAAGLVSDIAGNVWDAVKSLINDAIDKINSALEFEISIPGPNVHVNVANIPHLATGARATAGALAVIGEGREPETVFPDSVLGGFLERMTTAAAAGAQQSGRGGPLFHIDQVVAHDYNDFMVQAQRRKQQAALGGPPA